MSIPRSRVSFALFLLVASLLSSCASYTPEFRDGRDQIKPQSVAEIREVTLGGVKQTIVIRGANRNNPILLIIPGGGLSILPVMSKSNSALEEQFVVVHWDVRGTGKSYFNKPKPQEMSFEQIISDTAELTELLLGEFQQDKAFIMGWSLGSAISMGAVKKRPDLYYANIAVCQVVNFLDNERVGYDYVLAEANIRNNEKALRDLTKIGPPPYEKDNFIHTFKVKNKWLAEFDGIVHDKEGLKKTVLGEQFYSGKLYTRSKEYSFLDLFKIMFGMKFFITSCYDELQVADLSKQITEVQVPVYFFLGRSDYNAPAILAEQYFQTLEAPEKQLIWFEKSAHYPFLEEAEKFNREVENIRQWAM